MLVCFFSQIRAELAHHNIRLYPFDTDEHDAEEQSLNARIREMIPFAVVGSQSNVIIDGKPVRGRKNRYGVVNVEDERHCEFVYLRNFLTRCVPRPTTFFSCYSRVERRG